MRFTAGNSIGRGRVGFAGVAVLALVLGGAAACGSADGAGSRDAVRTVERRAAKPPRKPPVRFTVSVSGDILMHTPLIDRALANGGGNHYDFSPFFGRIAPFVARPEVAICHLETPLGPGEPTGYPRFNTPPALARSVARRGWDACDSASNHSLDQGAAGIRTTVRALDHADLKHTGSFSSRHESRKPTLIRVRRGLKLGLVAYTDSTNGLPEPAPWSVNTFDLAATERARKKIVHDARRARRAGADAVIVNLHWGAEYASKPSSAQLRLAREVTGSRAVSAVVGQGPHVVGQIERMHGKFVVFTEGNLVSNQSAAAGLPAATQDGLIALLRFVARGGRVRVDRLRYVPVWVRPGDYVVLPALPGEDPGHAGQLRASRRRTVRVVGRGHAFGPVRSAHG